MLKAEHRSLPIFSHQCGFVCLTYTFITLFSCAHPLILIQFYLLIPNTPTTQFVFSLHLNSGLIYNHTIQGVNQIDNRFAVVSCFRVKVTSVSVKPLCDCLFLKTLCKYNGFESIVNTCLHHCTFSCKTIPPLKYYFLPTHTQPFIFIPKTQTQSQNQSLFA